MLKLLTIYSSLLIWSFIRFFIIILFNVMSRLVSSFLFSNFSRINYTNRSSFFGFIFGSVDSFAAFLILISSSMCFRSAHRSLSTLCF